ncbi:MULTISPECIES: A/G-specific adenine glycosylase [Bradyrhizobium]|uniref:A/G-specific adenine glycosylase n=1 Tax=Bradyrhizobium TaxID=374 RepID=UPI00048A35BD|nr:MULTISPECIES: A/G-specific adenine glycosylase [Bradyrhizobium]MCS3446793.1 A/G-specific adenine glycosylase [Bradyrhizobium elkanii]MCS3562073.1 A/G-specific adenine glycosylase [Bradyrhizobium elkanii]MCW2148089.1 A/G-specific adenine glycosylase [Bradyrhizobium elkanii]MCW2352827.1 A/G-specific adenine glycosylase [Bradyrhizobium elkanii]MCW2371815.1 A/G-specific adenine glycosylase [Bradyrhizobium elkanii]
MSSRAAAKIKSTDQQADRPARLLAWYDRHRRTLPWRAVAGERADPYRVWLSEIMLQQTTVRAVGPYFEKFVSRWPDVTALGRASLDDVLRMWAGLGYYSRARNLHACAVAVMGNHGGVFPDTEGGLRALPGIGPYTAAAIAAIAFDRRTMPVDGNIERVVSRLYAIEEALPQAKPLIKEMAATLLGPSRAGDSAQALMDLGATICTPKKPACALCPLNDDCAARTRGDQEAFPRKAPKKSGILRRGAAFVVTRGGELLVRSRAEKGLLGGMTEVPGSQWLAGQDDAAALAQAPELKGVMRWHRKAGVVSHVFTHFPLELVVYTASVPPRSRAPEGMRWVPVATLDGEAFPNVMRKVIAHGLDL